MKMKIKSLLFLCAVVALVSVGFTVDAKRMTLDQRFADSERISKEEQKGEYLFDKAHSSVGFKVRHMGLVDVPGHFRVFDGTINFDPKKKGVASSVSFEAEMKSVDTGINARDNHLRNKDFFEVLTYPKMKFESTSIKKKRGRYRIKGNLTIKDVTREVEFPVQMYGPIKDQRGKIRIGVVGSTAINRRDFNVTYGGNLPNGTAVLSDNVTVDIQIEAVKKEVKKDEE